MGYAVSTILCYLHDDFKHVFSIVRSVCVHTFFGTNEHCSCCFWWAHKITRGVRTIYDKSILDLVAVILYSYNTGVIFFLHIYPPIYQLICWFASFLLVKTFVRRLLSFAKTLLKGKLKVNPDPLSANSYMLRIFSTFVDLFRQEFPYHNSLSYTVVWLSLLKRFLLI